MSNEREQDSPQRILFEVMQAARYSEERMKDTSRGMSEALIRDVAEVAQLFAPVRPRCSAGELCPRGPGDPADRREGEGLTLREKVSLTLLFLAATIMGMVALANKAHSAPEVRASWYGSELAGERMANGEPFDPSKLTVAHRTLPLNSRVTICKDSCVVAKVADRGPAYPDREFDLSKATADAVGLTSQGVDDIRVAAISKPVTQLPKTGGLSCC